MAADEDASKLWTIKNVRAFLSFFHLRSDIFKIIYMSCVGPFFAAVFLEWLLWLLAFTYCLFKAFRKADHWSQRVLAVLFFVLFLNLRY
jgi:hypothetical protein